MDICAPRLPLPRSLVSILAVTAGWLAGWLAGLLRSDHLPCFLQRDELQRAREVMALVSYEQSRKKSGGYHTVKEAIITIYGRVTLDSTPLGQATIPSKKRLLPYMDV